MDGASRKERPRPHGRAHGAGDAVCECVGGGAEEALTPGSPTVTRRSPGRICRRATSWTVSRSRALSSCSRWAAAVLSRRFRLLPEETLRLLSVAAVLGGLIIGVVGELSKAYLGTKWSEATIFAVLIIVLLCRPSGVLAMPSTVSGRVKRAWRISRLSLLARFRPQSLMRPCCPRISNWCSSLGWVLPTVDA